LVRPTVADAQGSGSRRRYGYRDLLELKVIKTLLDAGIKLESVRSVFVYLRESLGEDIVSAQLVISGESVLLVRPGEALEDVRRRGQFVLFSVLSLEGVQRELDAAIIELRPVLPEAAPRSAPMAAGAGGPT
ncbi:MAG TPA: MerR family transcriptional regulator, partial [Acidimicrobiales bacterium]